MSAEPRRRAADAPHSSRPSVASAAQGAPAAPTASSCEIPGGGAELERSCVVRFDGAGWDGVPAAPYKSGGGFASITRRLLAAPGSAGYEVRYFELEPGGHSSHERHEHVHVVVCLRGSGRVRLGEAVEDVGFGDVVHIAPGEAHQFLNPTDAPFGFLCIVDRERDRPVPVTEADLT